MQVLGDTQDELHETFTVTLSNPSGAGLGDDTGTGTIRDDDDPTATLVLTPDTIAENGGVSTVKASLDRVSDQDTVVEVTVVPVAPTTAGDYALSPVVELLELMIAAGETESTETFTITARDNDVDAPDKEVTLTATAFNTQGVSGPENATLTIEDDDDTPTVTLHLAPDTIAENGGASTVTARLDRASSEDTTVAVSVTPVSPAVEGDYTLSGSALTIAAGSTTSAGTVTIAAVNNAVDAPHKTLTVSATATNAWRIAQPQDVTLTVTDDENVAPTGAPTIDDTTPVVGETLTADTSGIGDSDGVAGVVYAYRWIRVASDGMETELGTGSSHTVAAADVGAKLKVVVSFTDDGGMEETVESLATATARAPLPTVTVEEVASPVTEGEDARFTVTRTVVTTGALTVNYRVSESGDVVASGDEGPKTVAFADGESEKTVTVPTVDDTAHAADSTVTVALTTDASYELGTDAAAEVTVEDDDNADPTGTVTIDDTTPVVGETLNADPSGIGDPDGLTSPAYTWQWIRTSGGTETPISGATLARYTVVAGDVGSTLKAEASFTDDDGTPETVESAETATVEAAPTPVVQTLVSNLDRYHAGVTSIVRVRKNRPQAQWFRTGSAAGGYTLHSVSLRFRSFGGSVGDGTFTVTLRENGSGNAPGVILHTLINPSRLRYDRVNAFTAPPGVVLAADTRYFIVAEYSESGNEPLWTQARAGLDVAAEGWQTSTPRYNSFNGGTTWSSAGPRGLTIAVSGTVNPSGLPEVSVEQVTSPVAEGADAQFTVTRTGVTTGALTVNYSVSETGDMVASGEEGAQTVAFADGESEKTVTVPTEGDSGHEADSTVTVTLTADASYALGTDATAEVTVEDDDNADPTGAPTIDDTTPARGQTLTADPSGITDPDGLTGPTYAWRWIRVASGGGETEVGTAATYTVVDADRGATLKVEVTFTDDDGTEETIESAETAVVELPAVITPSSDGDVTEGDPAVFTLMRTGSTAGTLRVKFDIDPSGGDFGLAAEDGTTFPVGSRTEAEATFEAGSSTTEVSLSTVDDNTHEADGTVFLSVLLSDDEFYALGDIDFAELKIRDNDNAAPTGAPTIDDTTPVVGETLTAEASGVGDPDGLTNRSFTWRWIRVAAGGGETEIGTAATYTVVDADVGATLKVEAGFTDDDGTEETIESAETSAVEALPALSIADASVDEGDTGSTATLVFTVTLNSAATEAVTVDWATSDGTATAGTDYTSGTGRLTFNIGDSSKTVSVTVTGDDVDEPDETLTVTLSGASGATLGDDTATGTIADDDDPPTVTLVPTPDTITEGRRSLHGDGKPGPSVEPGDNRDRDGDAGDAGDGERLRAERERVDDCGGCDDEHGRGDDHRREQRRGRAPQDVDGVGHGDERPGDHATAGRDADDHGRRERGADGRADDRRHDARGWRDAQRGSVGHRRRGRADEPDLRLAVDPGVGRHRNGHRDRGVLHCGRR